MKHALYIIYSPIIPGCDDIGYNLHRLPSAQSAYSGPQVGNRITSRIEEESVISMTKTVNSDAKPSHRVIP
jgi:hypothetical protein